MKKLILLLLLTVSSAMAQDMSGMDMPKDSDADIGMAMHGAFGRYAMNRDASGKSWQPDLGPAMGQMTMLDDWMLMSRLALWSIYDYQSGPRGGEMVYPAGMVMDMAQRDLGDGTLGFRAMLSPDALMGRRG